MKEVIFPSRIIASRGAVTNGAHLLQQCVLQITTLEPELTILENGASILLDFGTELCGGIRILTYQTDGHACSVKIRFGESAAEAVSALNVKNNVQAHTIKEHTLNLLDYSDIPCGQTGFRFVYLEVGACDRVSLKAIVAENEMYDAKPIWLYQGQDPKLQQIFLTAKRTIDLCVQNGLLYDGIKRDRLVWMGDMYTEMLALVTLYGRTEAIERSLDLVREMSPIPNWINLIPSYSLWWVVTTVDYCDLIGDDSLLRRTGAYLVSVMEQFNDCVSPDGQINLEEKFIDLNLFGRPEEDPALRAFALVACRKAQRAYEILKCDPKILSQLAQKLQRIPIDCCGEKTIAALKYWALGALSQEEKQLLCQDGCRNMSCFSSYFLLRAVAQLYGKEKAMEMLKSYFGAMLDLGATTFWENFDPAWAVNSIKIDELPCADKADFHGDYGNVCFEGYRMSLCHGWSAGVIKLIKDVFSE